MSNRPGRREAVCDMRQKKKNRTNRKMEGEEGANKTAAGESRRGQRQKCKGDNQKHRGEREEGRVKQQQQCLAKLPPL